MCDRFHWARLLAFVTGLVNQELLRRNEDLIAENRILRSKLPNRLPLSDPDRAVLGEIAKRLGRGALRDIARVARPDTILGWYRRLVAQKFDGSRHHSYPGRPRVSAELEALAVRFARENRSWGYDRIAGALANLGHAISDQTVGNILRRYKIPPAPERSRTTTWKEFIRSHMDVLAGVDFFTVEVLTWRGLITYYVLFFIEIGSRRVSLGGITTRPGRVLDGAGRAKRDNGRDRLPKQLSVSSARSRCQILQRIPQHARGGRRAVPGPAGQEPKSEFVRGTLGTFGERGVPVKIDLVRGELLAARGVQLPRALSSRTESSGQRKSAAVPHRRASIFGSVDTIRCRERLGGLLKFYTRAA